MEEQVLDVSGAARYLGVKPSTIRAWCLRRQIRYFKSGRAVRFRRAWLEEFIERNTTVERHNRPRV
jgi:excisionase family DNA binding protein